MNKDHYKVSGLGNSDMKTQLKNSLENIDGVTDVCIDMHRGSVEVMYNEPAQSDEIKECIEKTGNKII